MLFSDEQGNAIDSQHSETLERAILSQKQMEINYIISSHKEIILSDEFARTFIKDLTENQLKTFANSLSNKQLQVLAQNLTDGQLQKIVLS